MANTASGQDEAYYEDLALKEWKKLFPSRKPFQQKHCVEILEKDECWQDVSRLPKPQDKPALPKDFERNEELVGRDKAKKVQREDKALEAARLQWIESRKERAAYEKVAQIRHEQRLKEEDKTRKFQKAEATKSRKFQKLESRLRLKMDCAMVLSKSTKASDRERGTRLARSLLNKFELEDVGGIDSEPETEDA